MKTSYSLKSTKVEKTETRIRMQKATSFDLVTVIAAQSRINQAVETLEFANSKVHWWYRKSYRGYRCDSCIQ